MSRTHEAYWKREYERIAAAYSRGAITFSELAKLVEELNALFARLNDGA